MPKRHYTIYCDESVKKGLFFSNFYGGALIRSSDREAINSVLIAKKEELNLFKEVKWTYITSAYEAKYISFIDTYFDLVESGRIKLRIMFTHNRFKAKNLTDEHYENQYFILYYQMIKHAFGLGYCNPDGLDRIFLTLLLDDVPSTDEKFENFKEYMTTLSNTRLFREARVVVDPQQIADVDSGQHVILQGLDIVLGAIQFRLNDKHKEKPEGAKRRGKRTIAKERVYKHINRRIRGVYPNFNIGVSTGTANGLDDRWRHPYRHWKFVPAEHEVDDDVAK